MGDKSTPRPWEHGVVKGDPLKFYLDALKSIIRTVEHAEADGRPVREWHTITIPGEETIIANTGCGPSSAKNAALIVRAVNRDRLFGELVTELGDMATRFEKCLVLNGTDQEYADMATKDARDLLAKVKDEADG